MKGLAVCLALCLALSGCALLEREYSVVEPHNSRYWEKEADTLRAESYQDLVNDLLLLVGQRTEEAVIRLYGQEEGMSVSDAMERAALEVKQETPMGAYAVEYITSSSQAQRSYYEIRVSIRYRRTAEQIRSVVNATSTEALPELLTAALDEGRSELAVRISYFDREQSEVESLLARLRAERGLTETDPAWAAFYYPSAEDVGIIEFVLDGSAVLEEPDTAEEPADPGETDESEDPAEKTEETA